jgi:transmembrane sensor
MGNRDPAKRLKKAASQKSGVLETRRLRKKAPHLQLSRATAMAEHLNPGEDDLFEQAVIWAARLREPDAVEADRVAFAAWLAHDPRHAAAHREAQDLWRLLELPARAASRATSRDAARRRITVPRDWLAPQAALVPSSSAARQRRHLTIRAITGWCLAAGLTAAVLVWGWRGGFDNLRADVVTATGEQQDLTLPDNSRIKLNTDTAFGADLDGPRRIAHLYRGEAYFDIAHDASRPFIVETPQGRVTVRGTAFNIRLDEGRMVVSVERGHVAVTARDATSGDATSGDATSGDATSGDATSSDATSSTAEMTADLVAGQQVAGDARRLDGVTGFDASAVTAWQNQQLVFYRTPLGTVIEELNRYRQGRIILTDPALKNRVVSGIFDLRRPDAVLATLEKTLHLRATNLANILILLN